MRVAFDRGRCLGKAEGEASGYEDGYALGYDDGYAEGFDRDSRPAAVILTRFVLRRPNSAG